MIIRISYTPLHYTPVTVWYSARALNCGAIKTNGENRRCCAVRYGIFIFYFICLYGMRCDTPTIFALAHPTPTPRVSRTGTRVLSNVRALSSTESGRTDHTALVPWGFVRFGCKLKKRSCATDGDGDLNLQTTRPHARSLLSNLRRQRVVNSSSEFFVSFFLRSTILRTV
jgi:hypothetical protein